MLKTVTVQFRGNYKEYDYKTYLDLKIGDDVVCVIALLVWE